jgi:hypothetical protein
MLAYAGFPTEIQKIEISETQYRKAFDSCLTAWKTHNSEKSLSKLYQIETESTDSRDSRDLRDLRDSRDSRDLDIEEIYQTSGWEGINAHLHSIFGYQDITINAENEKIARDIYGQLKKINSKSDDDQPLIDVWISKILRALTAYKIVDEYPNLDPKAADSLNSQSKKVRFQKDEENSETEENEIDKDKPAKSSKLTTKTRRTLSRRGRKGNK